MYQAPVDPTAVVGKRIGAWIIDVVIAGALAIAVFLAAVDGFSSEGVFSNPCDGDAAVCTQGDLLIFYSDTENTVAAIDINNLWMPNVAFLAYGVLVFIVWQGLSGMTVGKAIFGIRTVREDGSPPGIGRATIRYLLWIVDAIPFFCFVPVVGGITMLSSKNHRRVGDMAASTFVVGKEYAGRPIGLPTAAAAAYTPGAPGAAPGPATTWAPPPGQPQPGPGQPEMSPDPTMVAGAAVSQAAATPSEPQWDAQRNAYIQWDEGQQCWLQFDDATQQWSPIT